MSRDPEAPPHRPSEPDLPSSVTVIGEALIDLIPEGTESFQARPGGSPFNTAIGLARLGVKTTLMARLSDNSFGRILRTRALAEGVDLTAAAQATEPTTMAVVCLNTEVHASYDFYVQGTADWQWTRDELALLPKAANVVHFGSLASWTTPGSDRIIEAIRTVRRAGASVVSYDPNIRPSLLGDVDTARSRVEQAIKLAHIVKASDQDIEWLYPGVDPQESARGWLELGPSVVIITEGGNGARAYRPSHNPVRRLGLDVDVVDTIGAGDSFTSGWLASLLLRGINSPATIATLTLAELEDALDDAIMASAITVQRSGADPPRAADLVQDWRSGHAVTPATKDLSRATAPASTDARSRRRDPNRGQSRVETPRCGRDFTPGSSTESMVNSVQSPDGDPGEQWPGASPSSG